MNPIPTTNAMKPAAGKAIPSFPTPVIKDTVIVEVVNAWKGDYVPLEYGAKWDDYPHASQQGSYPDHKLISQSPNSEDGQWVKRIWANDRVDQDTYNYAIKYSAGSDAHPIYIRTYLEPRDTYAPRLDNSPDPLFPSAVLVDEEVTRTEGEFDSRYVQVTRVYETLPGPVVPTKRINERGDLETINTQTVAPGTQPDPDGLLVTQTQVAQEEVSKGVKTTATVPSHSQLLIKEKKEGLLGETITTDDIVDPSTAPDALSQTIVASVVQQTSSTKAVKRTTTASGPTLLEGKKNNAGLLGEQTISESIVPAGTQPIPLSLNVVSSEVTPIDSAKSKSTVVVGGVNQLSANSLVDSPIGLVRANVRQSIVAPNQNPVGTLFKAKDTLAPIDKTKSQREEVTVANWPTVSGVDYDEVLGLPIQYTETIVSPTEYDTVSEWTNISNINYKPIDQWKSLKKSYNKDEIVKALSDQYYSLETQANISLPDTLESVIVYTGGSFSNGKNKSNTKSVGGDSYAYSIGGGFQSSSSFSADVYFKIKKGFNGYIKGRQHIFFLPIDSNGIVQSSVLNKLNEKDQTSTYQEWPVIRQSTENIVVITGSGSIEESKYESKSVSINGFSDATREDESMSSSSNAKSVTIPESLHGPIIVTTSAGNTIPDKFGAQSFVFPSTLQETSPPRFPSGKYLISSQMELYKWGMVKVTATTVEITEQYT
jgi:hypothetical protein